MTVLATDYHRLQAEVDDLREQVQEMADALRAAAAGELAPAEAFIAAGVLGIRDLEPGNAVVHWNSPRVRPFNEYESAHQVTCVLTVPPPDTQIVIRRLYVEPAFAPHFHIVGVYDRNWLLLGGGSTGSNTVPCELLSRRYGSPRLDWKFEHGQCLEVHLMNLTDRILPFHMLGLGYYTRGGRT